MSITIASLFLPYQPQFIVESFSDAAATLAKSDLVKIKEPSMLNQTSDLKESSGPTFLSNRSSTISRSATPSSTSIPPSSEDTLINNTAIDDSEEIVSSKDFLENLTTGVPPKQNNSIVAPPTSVDDVNMTSILNEKVITPRSRTLTDVNHPIQKVFKRMSLAENSFPSLNTSTPKTFDNLAKETIKTSDIFSKLPWHIVKSLKGNLGMFNAVETAIEEKLVRNTHTNEPIPIKFVGTLGVPTDELDEKTISNISKTLTNDYSCQPVITDDLTFKGAYKNFCKQILWPTLHYQIPDNPNSKAFENHSWNFYQHLNQQFADVLIKNYKKGDTIWVHDYHLMLVPGMVRNKLPDAKIGFYLHVSFPSSEIFRCFAQRELLLKGLCGANSIGFQTTEYARHFLQTCNRLLMIDVLNNAVKYKGKLVHVNSTPIGIDLFKLDQIVKSDETYKWRESIKKRWAGKRIIVSRDTIDPIRGIDKKLLAFERFLKDNPQYIDKVVLIQICLGGKNKIRNDYFERKVTVIADRINSISSHNIKNFTSQHVVFMHQEVSRNQYLALTCEADCFLITATREGMNLSCHDFITCAMDKKSPLLLSEFTGSAELLKEGAILINPWDIIHQSQSIKRAFEMEMDEKTRNWKKMAKAIVNHDSDNWISNSLEDINVAWELYKESSIVNNISMTTIREEYSKSHHRLYVLKVSTPPTARLLKVLVELINQGNYVYILSHFSKSVIEGLYSRVSNLGFIAESGAYVRLHNKPDTWYNIVEHTYWIKDVTRALDSKIERLPGSYYKYSDSMVRFHTENAEDQDRVASVVGEAISHINTLFGSKNIHAYLHKGILFVQEKGLSLHAVDFILRYYNTLGLSGNSDGTSTIPSSPLKSDGTNFNRNISSDRQHIDFVVVSGSSSPVIEPLFGLVNEAVNKKEIKYGHSIVYSNTLSTLANEHVDGANELMTVMKDIIQDTK